MADRCASTDRISHLPSEIIEKILNLLPCCDAVRTSILSSDWRYKWISMSDLDFEEAWRAEDRYAKLITQCLLRHQGPIRKFSVTALTPDVACKIKQWMKLVLKDDIEELRIISDSFGYSGLRYPSCLFNCKKLIHLELSGCWFKFTVPRTFEGFMNLKVLKLYYLSDRSSIIESLISKSPLLESINLRHIRFSKITISAPKLKYLSLQGALKYICLEQTPVLVDMILHLNGCNFSKIFGDAANLFNCMNLTHLDLVGDKLTIPPTFEGFMNLKALKLSLKQADRSSIESLICKSPLLESLSFTSYGSNAPITISAPKIKYLYLLADLKSINLEKSAVLADMSIHLGGDPTACNLIKILGGAPNLGKLAVIFGNPDYQYFKIGRYRRVLSTTFNYLKVMTLSEFELGESKAIPFVIELLTSAPNLEKLAIHNQRIVYYSRRNKVDSSSEQKEYIVRHRFMKLKVVEMGYILCIAPEIEFAKLILSNSPILEKMTIGTDKWEHEIISHTSKKLLTLPRASAQAAVTFHDIGNLWRPNSSMEF